MDPWTLGLLEVAPVALVAVIVVRHFRAARRAAAEERPRATSARPPA
jgi:hypothetical protein